MAPLIVMLVGWIVFRGIGSVGIWDEAASWSGALRFAFVVMFAFTAVSHFLPRSRADLIRMVPSSLPAPHLFQGCCGAHGQRTGSGAGPGSEP